MLFRSEGPIAHTGKTSGTNSVVSPKKKLHLVGWNKVTNLIDMGGPGIFEMKARNSTILAKLCWRIASSPNMPWAQMLTKKYLTPARLRGETRNHTASCIWRACKARGIVFTRV